MNFYDISPYYMVHDAMGLDSYLVSLRAQKVISHMLHTGDENQTFKI